MEEKQRESDRENKGMRENRDEEVYRLIGGDFNIKTGKEGGMVKEDKEKEKREKREKQSKNDVVNRKGRKLINCLEKIGWEIFNSCTKGDKQGEYTFIEGRGNTVIDYVIREMKVWDKIEEMRIGDKVDSDHLPTEIRIKRKERRKEGKKGNKEGEEFGMKKVETCLDKK